MTAFIRRVCALVTLTAFMSTLIGCASVGQESGGRYTRQTQSSAVTSTQKGQHGAPLVVDAPYQDDGVENANEQDIPTVLGLGTGIMLGSIGLVALIMAAGPFVLVC